MNVSIVIPAYNEDKRLETSLVKIIKFCESKLDKYEIIIVDDGSTDNTFTVAEKFTSNRVILLKNKINRGKGYSVKRGILKAKYPLVLFSDSDLATPINELIKFLDFINDGYDVVIASRNIKGAKIITKQPKYRQWLGKIFSILVRIITLPAFKDTQCGFKLFKTAKAKKIVQYQTLDRFSFDVELLYIAKKMNCKIKEAPVTWTDKRGTTVRLWKDTTKMLKDIIIIRINDVKGKYEQK